MARPLIDPSEANYSLTCGTCADAEDEAARAEDRAADGAVGDLSDGGNNLSRRAASQRAAAHLRLHPDHELSWTAMGATRRAPSPSHH